MAFLAQSCQVLLYIFDGGDTTFSIAVCISYVALLSSSNRHGQLENLYEYRYDEQASEIPPDGAINRNCFSKMRAFSTIEIYVIVSYGIRHNVSCRECTTRTSRARVDDDVEHQARSLSRAATDVLDPRAIQYTLEGVGTKSTATQGRAERKPRTAKDSHYP